MVEWRWVDNICYYEYTPTTITYDVSVDAFTVARADIYSSDRRHRIFLAVVVTDRQLTADRMSLLGAIRQGRAVLEWLVERYRGLADLATESRSYVFDISGQHLR